MSTQDVAERVFHDLFAEGEQIREVSLSRSGNKYSTTWKLSILGDGLSSAYIAKTGNKVPLKQVRLSRRADILFKNDDCYFSPSYLYNEDTRFIMSVFFDGQSFDDLVCEDGWPNVWRWLRRVEWLSATSARWLQKYHFTRARIGDIRPAMWTTLWKREAVFTSLDRKMKVALEGLIDRCDRSLITVPHGDFTPANILVKGDRLCVIDFGLTDWTFMSPCWDIATYHIAFTRRCLFRPRNVLKWMPSRLKRTEDAFWSQYDRKAVQDDPAWDACFALRHFIIFAGMMEGGGRDPRTAWHYDEMSKILAKY